MAAILNNPDHWYKRAAEARALADGLEDPERASMLQIGRPTNSWPSGLPNANPTADRPQSEPRHRVRTSNCPSETTPDYAR